MGALEWLDLMVWDSTWVGGQEGGASGRGLVRAG